MTSSKKPKLVCIVGPTASGKTEWGIKLAKKFDGEIISADSRQIYKGMDIGTGKITIDKEPSYAKASEGQAKKSRSNKIVVCEIPHYMINTIEPDEKFSAADFKNRAVKIIKSIHQGGKVPLLVGGTGLYVKAVSHNYIFPPESDPNLRKKLEKKPLKKLEKKLKEIDPKSIQAINTQNKRKLIRALQTALKSGDSFQDQKERGQPLYNTLQIGIETERKKLYKKIEKRVDKMIKRGLEEEVKGLAEKYGWDSILSETIGYQEWQGYFKEKSNTSKEKIIKKIKTHTRQYAKRQLTWFKNDKNVVWTKEFKKAKKLVEKHLAS